MLKRTKNKGFWIGIPPWIFIGAVAVLFPIFAFMTIENIHRYKENSTRLLVEKGSALIRSFEASTRTEMMGTRWSGNQLQRLLTETAQQPDIAYLLVANTEGTILAHNDSDYIGKVHGKKLNLEELSLSTDVGWRMVVGPEGKKLFEVFRMFNPGGMYIPERCRTCPNMLRRWLMSHAHHKNSEAESLVIFVGLDMRPIDEARKADTRHTVVMGLFLLFIGLAGILLLFLAQGYRTAKMSLSRIKAFSDNVVEHMPIGLFAIDSNERIASFNHVAGSVLRLPSDEAVGKDATEILPHELCKLIENPDIRQGVVEKEIECHVCDGKVVPLEVSATRLHDESGTFLGYVMLFKDLTEVRSLRKEIARSQRLASVGSLAAGVAHEIRNPLSSIKGFATYFKEKYSDVPDDQKIADILIQEVDRLNRVVGQLLELARPVSISSKSVHLRTLIEDSVRLIEHQAEEKHIEINTVFPHETENVFVDQDRISQVLLNLYLNAMEAMESGGNLSVEVSEHKEKGNLAIRVSDTGTGISKAELGRIFDPYFTTKSSGTGLGLAIVHNILEAHNGKIKVDSTEEEGTAVTIFLPCNAG
ncbi:ATP-binding protein [Desulfococcaceae bacterium HSG8]|nr:ATP-binding protein [Desulfococcaceae bacterium HSG8]